MSPASLPKNRRTIRLKGYDYSQTGAYYFTIVTHNRECLFGEIQNTDLLLNDAGKMVREQWEALLQRYPNIELDEFIVMPNHVHGILIITEPPVGAIHELPLTARQQRRKMLFPKILGYYKMNAAKRINILRGTQGAPMWQRNYWEHIIRNNDDLNRIRKYIANNPANWTDDENNPQNTRRGNS